MRKHFYSIILISLFIVILAISLFGCNNERNDRQYSLSELVGEYRATGTAYSSNEYVDYYLKVSKNGTATATRVYTNAASSRANPSGQNSSSTTTEFSGTITITKTNIKIGEKTGYVTTNNGRIIIHINNREYK